jgi:DNA-binding transcriptional LysR family regulator
MIITEKMNSLFSPRLTIEAMKMQNLEPILIFITVAEMGSFTHAADSLGIQKGRASTAVRKLEEDVGVSLLHRTTRSVQLTEDGRVFHARARDLLADVDDLHSMFAGDRVALGGRLRVDLPSELARTTIVPALPAFMATYPDLELEVSSTDRQVDLVQEGFDCVLRLGPIGDETLIARPLGKLRMVNAASPAYLARYGIPRSLEDLQHARLQLRGALHVNSVQTYEAAGVAGLGLIQAPLLGIGRYLESGALIALLPDFQHKPLDVSLVVAHRRNLSRRVRAFMKWIESVLAPHMRLERL